MGMTDKSLCNSCTNIGCEFQSGIVRTKCAFYIPSQLEPDNCGNYVIQDSTTKNDIRDNRVKNELNRVKDELEPTTKNDLGDDCVRRKAVLNTLERMDKVLDEDRTVDSYKELLKECYKVLPSVTPQEPKTGYISIDDVMSVFDDFMCGEVDEEGTETFWEMLKDKTESEKTVEE